MNTIEEIQKLYAKEKTYKIPKNPMPGQEVSTVVITPLGPENAHLLQSEDKERTAEEKMEKSYELASVSLGITLEEAKKISVGKLLDIIEAVMDANDFNVEELMKKESVVDMVERRKEALRKSREKDESKPAAKA